MNLKIKKIIPSTIVIIALSDKELKKDDLEKYFNLCLNELNQIQTDLQSLATLKLKQFIIINTYFYQIINIFIFAETCQKFKFNMRKKLAIY